MKNKLILFSILALFLTQGLYAQSSPVIKSDSVSYSFMSKKEKIDYIYKTGKFKDNTYANLMFLVDLNFNVKMNYNGLGFGAQYGKWISPYSAVQLGFAQGFGDEVDITHLGVDYVFNLSNTISYKEDRRFSVLPLVGLTGEYLNRIGEDERIYSVGVSVGTQLRYNLKERFGIILDARTSISSESKQVGRSSWANVSGLRVGFSYKFNQGAKYKKEKWNKYVQNRPNDLYALRDSHIVPVDSIVTNSVGLIDVVGSDIAAIDIEFSKYSDYLDVENKEIISTIALWLTEQNGGTIEIISFKDKGVGEELSENRSKVIFDEFVKNGVSKDDLKIVPFSENKYKFNHPANAVVVFTPNN